MIDTPEVTESLPNWAMLALLVFREATFWITRNSPASIKGATRSSLEKLDEVLSILSKEDGDGAKLIHSKRSDMTDVKAKLDKTMDLIVELKMRIQALEEYDERRP